MRKLIVLVLLVSACAVAFAQESPFFNAESEHYRVSSETSQDQADGVARTMEACFTLSNELLHLDATLLPAKMRVKIFKDADSFNGYLQSLLSQTRADFVFVSYSDPSKSELLGFTKEDRSFLSSLIHQGCIQLLKAYVANPPVWLREGLATYLEASTVDPKSGAVTFEQNFLWLDSLKAILKGEGPGAPIGVADLLMLTREAAQAQLDIFYPEAWGFVAFLLGSGDKEYNRVLWDTLSSLDPKAPLEDNSRRVGRKAFGWVDMAKLDADFRAYVLAEKTPQELLKDGVDSYSKGDMDLAEKAFMASLEFEPASSIAYYYLGLISYDKKDFGKAEEMYVKSFELGMSPGIVNYALGVNAFAGGKFADAAKYLKFSKDSEPGAYGEKVDTLLKRMDAAAKN
jgi:tetratricopeptide (TPR) repeat protein